MDGSATFPCHKIQSSFFHRCNIQKAMSRRRSFVDRASFLAIAAAAGAFGTVHVSAQDVLPRRLAAAEAGEQHKKPTAEPPTLTIQLRGRQQPLQQDNAGISLANMPTEDVHTDGGAMRQRGLLTESDEDGGAGSSKVADQEATGDMDMAAILDPFYGIDLDALGDLVVPIDEDHLPPTTGERRLNLLREMTEYGIFDDSEDDQDEEEEEDSSHVTNRIVNGQRTHLSSFVMTLDDRGGTSYRGVCGATMISKRWAVTAAHVSPTEAF